MSTTNIELRPIHWDILKLIRTLCYEGLPETKLALVDPNDRKLPRWEPNPVNNRFVDLQRLETIGSRVSYESSIDALVPKELLFERKYHSDAIYVVAESVDSVAAPGPHLRCDIVHDRNSGRVSPGR